MKKSSLGWLFLSLSIVSTFAVCLANAKTMDYHIFPFTPTTIKPNETVKIYNEVSFVQSNSVPPANFTWYVNGTEVISEIAASSTYTFTPFSVGVYYISAAVNGYSNGEVVTVNVTSEPQPSQTDNPITSTPTATVPEYQVIMLLPMLLLVLFTAAIVRLIRRK